MISSILIIYLLVAPYKNILCAKNFQSPTHPTIVHMPVKTAMQGQAISVTLKVSDDSGIGNARLIVTGRIDGKIVEKTWQFKSKFTSETMRIKVISSAASVFSGPSSLTDVLVTVGPEEVFNVYSVRRDLGFYQISLNSDLEGWISTEDAVPELVGDIYTTTIPAEMTFASELQYYASVENRLHNTTSTSVYTVGIISHEADRPIETQKTVTERPEPMNLERESGTTKRPFFKSAWFIGSVVAVSVGTAVILLSKKKTETGGVSIEVEW
jgi:hypothetical protein